MSDRLKCGHKNVPGYPVCLMCEKLQQEMYDDMLAEMRDEL